jgi:hypothetical protein
MDVGMVFAVALPVGVNEILLVRLIWRPPVAPVGTVITTGDQVAGTGGVAVVLPNEAGFSAAQVAVDVTPAASGWQK